MSQATMDLALATLVASLDNARAAADRLAGDPTANNAQVREFMHWRNHLERQLADVREFRDFMASL